MLFLVKLFSRGWIFFNLFNKILYQSTVAKTVQVAAKFKDKGDHKI